VLLFVDLAAETY